MSHADPPDWSEGTATVYESPCRGCDHEIHVRIPVRNVVENTHGVRVRCRECRTTTFIDRDSGMASAHGGDA